MVQNPISHSMHRSPELPRIIYPSFMSSNLFPDLYTTAGLPWSEAPLRISLSQFLYPASRRFFPVTFLWYSPRSVSRNTVNPNLCNSLYSFKLAGSAGALAKSTHSSNVFSSKAYDLYNKNKEWTWANNSV